MGDVWVIDAVRSPRGIGKIGRGSLAGLHPQNLLAAVLSALEVRNSINTGEVDDVIIGCGLAQGKQGLDVARMAVLSADWHPKAGGVTVSRFCGSGISAINMAATSIMAGMEDLVVAGGVEMMSYTSTLKPGLMDCGNLDLRKRYPQPHQGISADLIATLENASRTELDALALESQARANNAIRSGYFARSIISVKNPDGTVLLDADEYPRPQTTAEGLAALQPAFAGLMDLPLDEAGDTFRRMIDQVYPGVEINHVHHAGNSSGVVDGAAAVLLASPGYARSQGWKPRARIRAIANVGGDPVLMLNEPGSAARKVLARAGMETSDIDLVEINEAFAVVAWKFMRDLDFDPAICNVNGGAIALGHPIGATGAILLGTILDELERRDLATGLVTMCAGGGLAPALIVERI